MEVAILEAELDEKHRKELEEFSTHGAQDATSLANGKAEVNQVAESLEVIATLEEGASRQVRTSKAEKRRVRGHHLHYYFLHKKAYGRLSASYGFNFHSSQTLQMFLLSITTLALLNSHGMNFEYTLSISYDNSLDTVITNIFHF